MSTMARSALVSVNPATGEVVGEVPITPSTEVDAVVARARVAQPAWQALSLDERVALMAPAGTLLVERAETLGRLLTDEMGKPLPEGIGEVKGCGASIEHSAAAVADALRAQTREDDHTITAVHYDPFGVAAVIAPWNFPMSMPHWMIVPALVAGNTVVLKPSEETPLIAQAYVDALNESLPPDVLQVIHGADEQGRALVASDVDLIAFTGSRETGKKILAAAAAGLKRVVLELGGKDPLVVLEDADIEKAARFAAMNSFRNAGQVCVSTERIYVDEKIADAFRDAMVEVTKTLQVGPGTKDGTRIGPMVSAAQKAHVLSQVEAAKRAGARVAYDGGAADGNYVNPVILEGVSHDMEIMRDETFGPVACVQAFSSDDDAVRLANDSPFGLGAAVFGADETRAWNVARRIEAGMVGVNKGCGGGSGSPWVGAKQSGYGFHGSPAGHRQFAQVRVVSRPKGR
jgi:acyl-CoA reductase-like NAD-dependent aldehyde dehydrogenase